MIDIHSHVLPFIDDGSSSSEVSIQMLKTAVNDGVTDIIFTPHYRGHYKPSIESIKQEYERLRGIVEQNKLPINLYLGQELYVDKYAYSELDAGNVLTMNGTKYVLLEFGACEIEDVLSETYEFWVKGYLPIVAHVERIEGITLPIVEELISMGALVQINSSSIVGKPKRKYIKLIKQLFKNGYVHFVAGDVHENREYTMQKAYRYVSKKFGKQTADNVFMDNAKKIIEG